MSESRFGAARFRTPPPGVIRVYCQHPKGRWTVALMQRSPDGTGWEQVLRDGWRDHSQPEWGNWDILCDHPIHALEHGRGIRVRNDRLYKTLDALATGGLWEVEIEQLEYAVGRSGA